ncbi:Cyclic nucleotide-binding protein [Pseudocohnilembus persalinus]|uniref:Cyclic nucleotide-binding protein n=1 Tax=Pseudocohnilembus persalinus TaxID=266149 RepID=A0A0V0QUH6_PSEPJ|nr:Cyclic nucleotide-binding protein [Pseudocohnilembus persalinus]|eukprot:KRX05690.1 Cyclic nucleotide-binding protein [Pseudocohnilembus persalinus]
MDQNFSVRNGERLRQQMLQNEQVQLNFEEINHQDIDYPSLIDIDSSQQNFQITQKNNQIKSTNKKNQNNIQEILDKTSNDILNFEYIQEDLGPSQRKSFRVNNQNSTSFDSKQDFQKTPNIFQDINLQNTKNNNNNDNQNIQKQNEVQLNIKEDQINNQDFKKQIKDQSIQSYNIENQLCSSTDKSLGLHYLNSPAKSFKFSQNNDMVQSFDDYENEQNSIKIKNKYHNNSKFRNYSNQSDQLTQNIQLKNDIAQNNTQNYQGNQITSNYQQKYYDYINNNKKKTIQGYTRFSEKQQTVFSLWTLALLILLVSHFSGCFFNLLAYLEKELDIVTWLNEEKYGENWIDHYINSLYWAVITMITVGYGDITPVNTIERIFVIVITLISCGIFGYSLNSIGVLIENMTRSDKQFQIQMSLLTKYMKKRQITHQSQLEVKKYFEYLNIEQQKNSEQNQVILNQLTGTLQRNVKYEIYGKILDKHKMFKLNFSQEFIKAMSLYMQEKRFPPNTLVFDINQFHDTLYFVMDGQIKLNFRAKQGWEKKNNYLRKMSNGQVFNEIGFFTEKKTITSASTCTIVQLACISRKDFLFCLQEFNEDQEAYYQIRDKLNLYKQSRGLGIKCISCDNYSHFSESCPFVHNIVSRDKTLHKFIKKNGQQKRKKYTRLQLKLDNTLYNSHIVRESVINYMLDTIEGNDDELLRDIEKIFQSIQKPEEKGQQIFITFENQQVQKLNKRFSIRAIPINTDQLQQNLINQNIYNQNSLDQNSLMQESLGQRRINSLIQFQNNNPLQQIVQNFNMEISSNNKNKLKNKNKINQEQTRELSGTYLRKMQNTVGSLIQNQNQNNTQYNNTFNSIPNFKKQRTDPDQGQDDKKNNIHIQNKNNTIQENNQNQNSLITSQDNSSSVISSQSQKKNSNKIENQNISQKSILNKIVYKDSNQIFKNQNGKLVKQNNDPNTLSHQQEFTQIRGGNKQMSQLELQSNFGNNVFSQIDCNLNLNTPPKKTIVSWNEPAISNEEKQKQSIQQFNKKSQQFNQSSENSFNIIKRASNFLNQNEETDLKQLRMLKKIEDELNQFQILPNLDVMKEEPNQAIIFK